MLDRVHPYTPHVGNLCVLCSAFPETHAHLFFECAYSKVIWSHLKDMCGRPWNGQRWPSFIAWASQRWRGKSPSIVVKKLCLAVAVYSIWRERNNRIFGSPHKTSMVVTRSIIDTIRSRLLSINLKDWPHVALKWNISISWFVCLVFLFVWALVLLLCLSWFELFFFCSCFS